MDNLHQKFESWSYWRQILFLIGLPILLGFLIYKFNPLISNSSLGLLIIIALWWLVVFGWLNFYRKKEQLREFAIQVALLSQEDRERLILNANIQLDADLKLGELEENIYPKAEAFIENVNRTSRYKMGIWH